YHHCLFVIFFFPSFFCSFFFFSHYSATTEIYTLSLHDALPIFVGGHRWGRRWSRYRAGSRRAAGPVGHRPAQTNPAERRARRRSDRKSTRLNSSHGSISYAVFCLKKKKNKTMLKKQ